MSEPPRCPKCGKPPPVRRVDSTVADLRLTIDCNGKGCGARYEIQASDLKNVETEDEAA